MKFRIWIDDNIKVLYYNTLITYKNTYNDEVLALVDEMSPKLSDLDDS